MDYVTVISPDGDTVRVSLTVPCTRIGRSSENDLVLRDPAVSRSHAMIERRPDGCFVVDLGGRNGTYVNDNRTDAPTLLRAGDTISIGNSQLVFNRPGAGRLQLEGVATDHITHAAPPPRRVGTITPPPLLATEKPTVLQFLFEADQELVLHRPLSELFTTLLDIANRVVPYERGAIVTLEEGRLVEQMTRVSGGAGEAGLTFSRGITKRVLEGLESVLVRDALEDLDLQKQPSIVDQRIRSAMCVPLRNDQSVLGLLYLDDRRRPGAFNDENLRILTHLANIAAVKIENKKLFDAAVAARAIEDELRHAATIVSHLLPRMQPDLPGYAVDGLSRPGAQIGGDFFNYYPLPGGRYAIALGDVAGKGLPAALLMCAFESIVSVLAEQDLGPGPTVTQANRTLARKIPDNRFVTLFFGVLDPQRHRVTYINAGQNQPLIVGSDGRSRLLGHGGLPLGMIADATYREHTAELHPGDALVIYSDGVTEAVDGSGEEFGPERLQQEVAAARHGAPREVIDAILRAVEDHEADLPQADDITLVVLKRS